MTEFQIGAGLQETNNKGKKQQATKTNSAPTSPTTPYTIPLIKRVVGLVRLP